MMTDPIADMLTRIRNALMARHQSVEMPASKQKEGIARVLKREGFIEDLRVVSSGPHRMLKLYLKYGPIGEEVIRRIERVSTVANGLGIAIVSTNRGILSDRECRRLKVGGEVICTVM